MEAQGVAYWQTYGDGITIKIYVIVHEAVVTRGIVLWEYYSKLVVKLPYTYKNNSANGKHSRAFLISADILYERNKAT